MEYFFYTTQQETTRNALLNESLTNIFNSIHDRLVSARSKLANIAVGSSRICDLLNGLNGQTPSRVGPSNEPLVDRYILIRNFEIMN